MRTGNLSYFDVPTLAQMYRQLSDEMRYYWDHDAPYPDDLVHMITDLGKHVINCHGDRSTLLLFFGYMGDRDAIARFITTNQVSSKLLFDNG